MNIIMNWSRKGSPNGFDVFHYGKGIVYFDVPHTLAVSFIREGSARLATLQDMDDQLERARAAV